MPWWFEPGPFDFGAACDGVTDRTSSGFGVRRRRGGFAGVTEFRDGCVKENNSDMAYALEYEQDTCHGNFPSDADCESFDRMRLRADIVNAKISRVLARGR
jgi:hypothetical protein